MDIRFRREKPILIWSIFAFMNFFVGNGAILLFLNQQKLSALFISYNYVFL